MSDKSPLDLITTFATKAVNSLSSHSTMCRLQVMMFFVCAMFLAIRGATGAVAIYLPYQRYWVEDRLYYPLDTFPEYLTLLILSWPAFLAQMAQAYPRATQGQGKNKDKGDSAQTAAAGP